MQHINRAPSRLFSSLRFSGLLCLALFSSSAAFGQTISGGTYTFTSTFPVQLSSISGVPFYANSVTVTLPAGVCNKVYVGDSAMNTATFSGVGKILFHGDCTTTDTDQFFVQDDTTGDLQYQANGLETSEYWVSAAAGTQIQWSTYQTNLSASSILHWYPVGAVNASSSLIHAGTLKFLVSVIPGMTGKIDIVAPVGSGSHGPLLSLYPQNYVGGVLTTPVPQTYILSNITGNNQALGFTWGVSPEVSGEYALYSYWTH